MIDPVVFIKSSATGSSTRTRRTGSSRRTSSHRLAPTSGGSWQRLDRATYRVPGWGDVEEGVMTALLEVGYDYVLSFEHEDPVMSEEDGASSASSS